MSITKTAQSGEWVTVPREPTLPMLQAYQSAFISADRFSLYAMWGALLAASPPAPAAEPVAWVPEQRADSPMYGDEPIGEQKSAWDYNAGWNACRAAMIASAPPPVAKAAEPVAWVNRANLLSAGVSRERGSSGDRHTWSETPTAYHTTPLYAAPPPVEASQQQAESASGYMLREIQSLRDIGTKQRSEIARLADLARAAKIESKRLAGWLLRIDGGDSPCTDAATLRRWAYEAVTLGKPVEATQGQINEHGQ